MAPKRVTTPGWSVDHLPKRTDSTFLVTGATGGIGYFIAEQLATTGAEILLAGRSERRLRLAEEALLARQPSARIRSVVLDIAALSSVRKAAEVLAQEPRIDGVVLNAGVLARAEREETVDGHELVYGTNHLGHFALAGLIYPTLAKTDGSRIITVGSLAARRAVLDLDELEAPQAAYKGFDVYKRSKLAQTIFAFELAKRLELARASISSVVAHPGGALDGLTPSRPPAITRTRRDRFNALPYAPFVQGKDHAAWPIVRALLDPEIGTGQLWGPRLLRFKGSPVRERPTSVMTDAELGMELWTRSEQATGVAWLSATASRDVAVQARPDTPVGRTGQPR